MASKQFLVDCVDTETGETYEVAVDLDIDDLDWKVSVVQLFSMKFDVDPETIAFLIDQWFVDITDFEEQIEDELQERYSRDAREKLFIGVLEDDKHE